MVMRPVLPGMTGLVLNWGWVQPHDVEAFEMSKGGIAGVLKCECTTAIAVLLYRVVIIHRLEKLDARGRLLPLGFHDHRHQARQHEYDYDSADIPIGSLLRHELFLIA